MNNKNLIIFTSTFPYGFAETFLEDELPYLAKHFEKIIIFPFRISEKKLRAVPPNCVVSKPIVYGRFDQYLKGLFNARACCVFIRDFFCCFPTAYSIFGSENDGVAEVSCFTCEHQSCGRAENG